MAATPNKDCPRFFERPGQVARNAARLAAEQAARDKDCQPLGRAYIPPNLQDIKIPSPSSSKAKGAFDMQPPEVFFTSADKVPEIKQPDLSKLMFPAPPSPSSPSKAAFDPNSTVGRVRQGKPSLPNLVAPDPRTFNGPGSPAATGHIPQAGLGAAFASAMDTPDETLTAAMAALSTSQSGDKAAGEGQDGAEPDKAGTAAPAPAQPADSADGSSAEGADDPKEKKFGATNNAPKVPVPMVVVSMFKDAREASLAASAHPVYPNWKKTPEELEAEAKEQFDKMFPQRPEGSPARRSHANGGSPKGKHYKAKR